MGRRWGKEDRYFFILDIDILMRRYFGGRWVKKKIRLYRFWGRKKIVYGVRIGVKII